mmetsp:Transcript_20373/g.49288  ORF Transcript_20373/g.49288 Transcript_20373/m.49288 type:complete len:200 (-) Transcript_20373:3670-4269(-)
MQLEVEHPAERELVVHRKLDAARTHELVPVTVAHRRVVQLLHERERRLHVLHRVLEPLVHRPVLHHLVAPLHLLLELLVLLLQHLHVDVVPSGLAPLGVDGLDHRDHVPHLLELRRLPVALVDLAVLDHIQLEQLLQLVEVERRVLDVLRRAQRHLLARVQPRHLDLVGPVMDRVDQPVRNVGVVEVGVGHLLLERREE